MSSSVLISIFKILNQENKQNFLEFDCHNILLVEEDWENVLKILPTIQPDILKSLNWSMNSVDEQFFDFLDRAPHLSSISLDGIINDDSNPLKFLHDFILANETVEYLSVKGINNTKLSQRSLSFLFNALKNNANLKSIDFSNHSYGELGLKSLSAALLENDKIQSVVFSPCGVSNKNAFDEFFFELMKREVSLNFPWPQLEMTTMLSSNVINSDDMRNYRSKFNHIISELPQNLLIHRAKSREFFIPLYRQAKDSNHYYFPSFTPIQSEKDFQLRVNGIKVPEIPHVDDEFFEEQVAKFKHQFSFKQLYT